MSAAVLLAALVLMIEMQAIEYACARIGILARHMFGLLALMLGGSYLNISLWRFRSGRLVEVGEDLPRVPSERRPRETDMRSERRA